MHEDTEVVVASRIGRARALDSTGPHTVNVFQLCSK